MQFRTTLILSLVFANFPSYALMITKADESKLGLQVVSAWKELDKATQTTSAEMASQRDDKEPKVSKFAIQGDKQKLENKSQVFLRTDSYSYDLRKKSDGGWVIERLTDEEDSNFDDLLTFRKFGYSVDFICLLDAVTSPHYQFSDWRNLENGDIEFKVKVVSELAVAPGSRPLTFTSLTIQVDPTENCRIVEVSGAGRINEKNEVTSSFSCKYDYATDLYCPSKVTRVSEASNGKNVRRESSFSGISHDPLPASEFTLSHYGIQEVFPQKWRLSNLATLASCLLLGIGVCYFSIRYIRR